TDRSLHPGVDAVGMRPRPDTPELADRRAAVAELGAALRELLAATVLSEAPVDVLRQVATQVTALTEPLAAVQRPLARPASVDDLVSGVRMYNPVIGEGSPVAPPLRIEYEDDRVLARCTLGPQHEGPHLYAHGGVTAMLLDQILGHAVAAVGAIGVTIDLTTRYRRPVPLGEPLLLWAEAVGGDGERTTARGALTTASDPDTPLAQAEGRFRKLELRQVQRMYAALFDTPDP
ncbi:MAG: PaaI family thioesterase, partial [Thermocrispum sp.]